MANQFDDAPHLDTAEEEAASPRVSPLKRPAVRRALLAVLILVVLAFLAWLIRYETYGKYIESTNDAYIQADSVAIAPKVSGYVEEVFVADNQDVKKDQPLVRIDPRDYRAQAAQYQAQIEVASANVDNIRAGSREQEAAIVEARAQLSAAENDAAFAASQVARYTPLAATGAETREKLNSLKNQSAQAANKVQALRAALTSAERRIDSLQAQVRQAQAQGQAARAQLAAADVNLGSTTLRASVGGRIGDKTVRVGQFVQAGTRLMSLVPLRSLYVVANLKETQIGMVRVGQPVTIHVDALPGVDLRGHVESLSPGTGAQFSLLPPQNATGNFTKIVQRVPVRIAIDAGPEARAILVPGLSVVVEVNTASAKGSERHIIDQEEARRKDVR